MLRFLSCLTVVSCASISFADPPDAAYIFPAGGQRGTTVEFRVGGFFLHEGCPFHMRGPGMEPEPRIERTETIWFEGPIIFQPDSQRREDYPQDYLGRVKIAGGARLGVSYWHVSNSQGTTASRKFVVGELPEVVEREIDGRPIPTQVTIPVTINGRIFPREDIDVWTFDAQAGETITCEVNAARLGSALDSRIEVRGPGGRRIAENVDTFGADSFVRFSAPADGNYAVHIHDVNYDGLQHFVYRLSVTNAPYLDFMYPLGGRRGGTAEFELEGVGLPTDPVAVTLPDEGEDVFRYVHTVGERRTNPFLLEVSDLPEVIEGEATQSFQLPAVLNGRISQPRDVDTWMFEGEQGEQVLLDLKAARLGSPLDSVLTLLDAGGKELGKSDDLSGGQTDSQLSVKLPADGTYTIRVEERLPSRGGSRFAYRLHATNSIAPPGFRLELPADAITVDRGGEAKLKLNVVRLGGYKDEIELQAENLPEGVTLEGAKVGKNKNNATLVFKAAESAKPQAADIVLTGQATIGEEKTVQRAVFPTLRGEPPIDRLRLAVAVATPFKFSGEFESPYASRGTVHRRRYKLELGDYAGPLEISLADKQVRHLQGVTGPKITLPPGTTEFEYPVTLPAWLEVGRTSRTCIMAVGVVEDADGAKHKVSYSSQEQNDQIIVLTDPERLSVTTLKKSVRVEPGGSATIPVQVGRAKGLSGAVRVVIVTPQHIDGVAAEPATIPAGATDGQIVVTFAEGQLGPFNMPVKLRATLVDADGNPVTAETRLELVQPQSK